MVGVQKRKIRWAISLLLVMLYFSGMPAQAQYGGGSGEHNDPYLIYTAEQMNAIGAEPNDWDKHFKLMADIDLSGYMGTDFNIIGYWISWEDYKPFAGVFDGNGKTISNFNYNSTDRDCIGLFGYVYGEIKDLGLIDPNIDAGTGDYVGSLIGDLQGGTITNCYAEGGSVSGDDYVGGLVGSGGTIANCYSSGSVSGNNSVGGLAGSGGIITNCYATGNVTGNDDVGGLVGGNWEGDVSQCYSTGAVIGTSYVGGLVGHNESYGLVTECYSSGSVSGDRNVGGLVGGNAMEIEMIYSWGLILNCHSSGSVSGVGGVGGLVGWNGGAIDNCYATGSVTGTANVGGLVGDNDWGGVQDSFWDTQTSGQSTSDGGIGKTTVEMQTASTFLDAGWDFVGESVNGAEDIWSICEGTNYPRLVWQIPAGDFVCPDGITIEDFVFFTEYWRDETCDLSNDYCQGTDLDFSGTVDEADLEILVENWLAGGND